MLTSIRWWIASGACCLALSAAPVRAQESPSQPGHAQQAPHKGSQGQQQHQLSDSGKQALARLYALNTARAAYAQAGATQAEDAEVKAFLRQRAQEYEQSNTRLKAFAETYGVDMSSPAMMRAEQDTMQQWSRENQKLAKAHGAHAANMALSTFIERNEQAINDLRTLRGEVQEDALRDLINQRIASLEEESTRAQQLKREVQSHQKSQPNK